MRIEEWDETIAEAAAYAVEIRRELHRRPELGGSEHKTVYIIERELKTLGLEPERVTPTGVCAAIRNGEAEKTIAIRADIDGLPIRENTGLAFSSENEGYMHACGHDAHTAIALGTAMVLGRIKKFINANIKFIFQPNEEQEGGAWDMIRQGALDAGQGVPQKASMILGLHVTPELPAGSIGLKYGKVHAESIMFRMAVKGVKSHGAEPQKGTDAIVCAAQIISATQLLISRELSPVCNGLITFGKIQGGEAKNVLAEEVVLEGIIRGEDRKTCLFLKNRLEELAYGVSAALKASVEIRMVDGYPALVNDDSVVNHLRGSVKKYNEALRAAELCGSNSYIQIREIEPAGMTVDDFAFYLKEIPGAYFFLGAGFRDRKNSGLHTSAFEVNEDCIRTGIAALTAAVVYAP